METNHVKLIDRYLNNDLTRAQQMEFEHKLEDLSFREKLMEQARLMDMQKEVFEDQIKNDIIQGAVLLENNNSFFVKVLDLKLIFSSDKVNGCRSKKTNMSVIITVAPIRKIDFITKNFSHNGEVPTLN